MSVLTRRDGAVETITLDRPEVLNAFDDEMGARALEAVEAASEADDVRCIVITGAGRAFSSGEDLGALQETYEAGEAPELGDTLIRRYNPLVRAITRAPKPVVAQINGVAAGAGASVALACDYRIASERAKLVIAFIKVGLVPDSGALWFLQRMVGNSRAWQLATSGEPLEATWAEELGIFHRVVPPDSLEETAAGFARELASGPTKGFALTKQLLLRAAATSLDEQLDSEVRAQTEAGRSQDHLEGVRAFLGKRKPEFRGR